MLLFSRLLVLVERDDDMKECFKYELTPIRTSLFELGMMRKPNKSAFGRAIKQDVSPVTRPASSFHVLDGALLLHKGKWSPKATYEIFINLYVFFVYIFSHFYVESMFLASVLHLLLSHTSSPVNPFDLRSSLIQSVHLRFGLPLLLLPCISISITLLPIYCSSLLMM